jgi:hypothetical protein
MPFAKEQPKNGDTIMHCGHLRHGARLARPAHWFRYESPIKFTRPDGSRGEAAWFAACEACFIKHGEQVVKFVRGDGRWEGNDPVVFEEEPS